MRYKQPGLPIQMQIQKDPCLKMTKRSQTERIFSLFDNRQMAFDIFTSRICVLKNFALQIIYSESVVCKGRLFPASFLHSIPSILPGRKAIPFSLYNLRYTGRVPYYLHDHQPCEVIVFNQFMKFSFTNIW